jgi:hypothetical protein
VKLIINREVRGLILGSQVDHRYFIFYRQYILKCNVGVYRPLSYL